MWFVKLLAGLAVAYAAIVGALYLAQTWLIFPASLAARGATPLPPGAERIEIAAEDGSRLVGTVLPPRGEPAEGAPLVLGFGGNAWNADTLVAFLRELYPDRRVAAFHYRGYAPSTGRPSAAAILDDALLVHDRLREETAGGIVVVGLSIGAGPAARIAAERPVTGIILVTPFDSLAALARHHYPWVPVGPFLRHRMPIAETLAQAEAPAAVITAARDTIVPAARSAPVAAALHDPVLVRELAGLGHNDLYGSPELATAMREALERIEARRR